jgi:hypothetical protein
MIQTKDDGFAPDKAVGAAVKQCENNESMKNHSEARASEGMNYAYAQGNLQSGQGSGAKI